MATTVKLSIIFGLIGTLAHGVPLTKDTAVIESRIVGGVIAEDGIAPYMMALVHGDWVPNLMCGASLVSPDHALTAAHCIAALISVNGNLIPSLVGVYGSNKWHSTEKSVKFTHQKMHEEYNWATIKNDIGMLFMANPLPLSEKVAVIPLGYDWVEEGDNSYVTGWGRLSDVGPIPEQLQILYVETISEKRCLEGVEGLWSLPIDYSLEICTLHPKGAGFGMCNGDSGSALVSTKTKTQSGIVSWGFPCAVGAPDFFVRISAYKTWLQDILDK